MRHTLSTLWRVTCCLAGLTVIPFLAFGLAANADNAEAFTMAFLLKTTGFVMVFTSLASLWMAFWRSY